MIIQINIFSCDICNKIIKQTMEETCSFSDPLVPDSEFTSFKKFDIILGEKREMYTGEACKECVSFFGQSEGTLEDYEIDYS